MSNLRIESRSEVDEDVSVHASRASRWKHAALFMAVLVLLTVVGGFLLLYFGVTDGAVTSMYATP